MHIEYGKSNFQEPLCLLLHVLYAGSRLLYCCSMLFVYVYDFLVNLETDILIYSSRFIFFNSHILDFRFRHYYVQEISYYVQAPGHNKRYFPVLLAWHSVRELRKLSSCCYYVQFGGHDNYNISTGSPYKYRIVLIVNNW